MNHRILHKISYGLYIVSSRMRDRVNGQIANTVFQATSDPPTIAVAINKQNLTHTFISESGVCTVSILSQDAPLSLIRTFGFRSGRDGDKFADLHYRLGENQVPVVLEYTLGHLELTIVKELDVGSHTIFVGEVRATDVFDDGEPMTYDYYHKIKRGTTPKTAPTFIKEEEKMENKKRYKCAVCGYVYDPKKGDPEGNIAPGVPFEELPDDWVCPVCGAGKGEFEEA
ncbi:MAG: flavin reductase [Thermodesulfobacteriota bacterium]|nr:flavin reductase [Thermodesulfobacteriota bacterium]